jgi:fatty-acyl-CoA synthase
LTLYDILDQWAQTQPGKTALHFHGEDISYAELAHRVVRASEALSAELGILRGDRVGYLGYNRPEMLVLLFALSRVGAMLLPLNFRLAAAEHQTILEDADPKVLVVGAEFLKAAQPLRSALPQLQMMSIGAQADSFRPWNAIAGSATRPLEDLGQAQDPVLLVYTSGTTGRPKGAVHTQEGLIWNAINSVHCHDLTSTDHVLTVLPMFHVGGLCIQTVPALYAGATVTLHERFDAAHWLADVAARKPTLSLLVPATIKAVLEHDHWSNADLSSLRALYTGSSTVPAALFPPFHTRGIPLGQVYGATETGPVSIYLRAEYATGKAGSAGKAALHGDVRLVDRSGRDAATSEVGEIWVRAPNVMRGYWKQPPGTGFEDGWFKTGDLARQDEAGFYWVVGRSKDMIISGGENIYPAEIENILAECPDILEAAVIGMPDERWGEVVVAAIVKKPESALDAPGIVHLLAGRLARFKQPRRVVFLSSLPKNALGKVQKPALREAMSALT